MFGSDHDRDYSVQLSSGANGRTGEQSLRSFMFPMNGLTLRSINKADKQRRIQEAARQLFGTQGFDKTSTREIASVAGVGLATLFLYASDKRDLLFLAANDDLEALTATAFANVDYDSPLLSQLIRIFGVFFRFYNKNRLFSRDLLRELTFFTSGHQSVRFQATRKATVGSVTRVVAQARSRGRVNCSFSDENIAEAIFYIFAAGVRRWLGQEKSTIASGMDHLKTLLSIVLRGLRHSD
jgi:AcrR family transcriptional regulator